MAVPFNSSRAQLLEGKDLRSSSEPPAARAVQLSSDADIEKVTKKSGS